MARRKYVGLVASLLILITCLKPGAASAQEPAPARGPGDDFAVQDRELYTPGPPVLRRLDPPEGMVDTQIRLALEGEGFRELGEIREVIVAGVPVPILEFARNSDNAMAVTVHLLPDLPPGEAGIAFVFENHILEAPFHIRRREPGPEPPEGPRGPRLIGLHPHAGEANADVELFLEGENLLELGELRDVTIGGVSIPVRTRDIGTNDSRVIGIHLPEETPRGDQTLVLVFDGAEFAEPFLVASGPVDGAPPGTTPGIPPEIIIVIVVVTLVGGGVLLGRLVRGHREPTQKERHDRSRAPQPTLEFIVRVDPGAQSIELHGRSIIARR